MPRRTEMSKRKMVKKNNLIITISIYSLTKLCLQGASSVFKGAAEVFAPGDSPTCAPPASGYLHQKGHKGNLMRTADSPTCIPLIPPTNLPIKVALPICISKLL